jgi:drug/metabolite transporter (DMT)-like permease
LTAAAVVLALLAAVVFGVAAVTQHRAVRATSTGARPLLSLRQLGRVVADPGWRRGFALMVLGTGLHVTALSLSPISLTQPINVMAVPTTIAVRTALTRRRPSWRVVLAAVAVVIGVALLVLALSQSTPGGRPDPTTVGRAAAVLLGITGLLHLTARLLLTRSAAAPSWGAPVLLGIAGAANFATASAIFRLLTQSLDGTSSLSPDLVIALAVAVPVALAVGAWSIHQAYAAGAAAAVTATSALTDPVVAVVLGIVVLGESHPLTHGRTLLLVAAAALAVAGVVQLNRHDDGSPPLASADSLPTGRSSRARPSRQDLDAHLARR